MSLFAAYADQAKSLGETQGAVENSEWLKNSSFKSELVDIIGATPEETGFLDSQLDEQVKLKLKKKRKDKKHKKEKKRKKIKIKQTEIQTTSTTSTTIRTAEEEFFFDKTATREYLSVKTISRPAVPKYKVFYYLSAPSKHKTKFKRYYKLAKLKVNKESDDEKTVELTWKNYQTAPVGEREENYAGFTQEEELTKTTAYYNKNLEENPNNIHLWLQYIKFQDTVAQFEKTYKKGSIAKAQRVQAERKISILDKAINLNPSNELLLRERVRIAVSVYPADELKSQFKKLVDKEKDNIILWQGYIEATQCSMSHCTSPAVLQLYTQCLATLHKLRRSTISDRHIYEESILRMLYQCGLFLKQAGLFEQLWVLLKMYLQLNLSPSNRGIFNIERYVEEEELLELEEVVLNSQLPHHELWLRLEKLRESCHWLPYTGEADCEDPQRVVFNADVIELIHPITMSENIFKLVAAILALLKVPLLPCRHSTMQDLGLDYVPWSLDSIEALLPIFFPIYPVDTFNKSFLLDTTRLVVGPQYLKALLGQEEYLNFVLTIMELCAECLKDRDRLSARVWWFRFQRLLIILDAQGRFKLPEYFKKKIKTSVKELLKRDENRDVVIFYIEYAFIEKALGNSEHCIQILKTALNMNKNSPIVTINWGIDQINRCHLYRVLMETIIEQNSGTVKLQVQELLVQLVLQRHFENLTNGLIVEAESKFKTITDALLEGNLCYRDPVEHFLPDFFVDWLICRGWFLFYTKGPLQCGTFLEDIIAKLELKLIDQTFQIELLYEFYCAILFKYCLENPGSGVFKILDNVLFRAIEKYPNNLFLLAILAKEHCLVKNFGLTSWKVQDLLLKSRRSISAIVAVVINDLIRLEMEKETNESVIGNSYDFNSVYKNRTLALFKKITAYDTDTRRCGLVWRLYLQFVHTYFDLSVCRNVYFAAVEECPWFKPLYMDAAIYIPAELGPIQDLLIEKELRLHLTPEELDVLRS
ncbi:hypothetical protein ABEB36_005630 [Hypothenemus hampei]|uniref:Protein NRDE2 homolog n=1 Tax=Hypothenemus hampei TaxID=57062 RepID=A0ABD1EZB3_HYPHA